MTLSLPKVGRAEVHSTTTVFAFFPAKVPIITPSLCLYRPRPELRPNCSKFSLKLEFLAGSAASSGDCFATRPAVYLSIFVPPIKLC